jgi:hypothetical protein
MASARFVSALKERTSVGVHRKAIHEGFKNLGIALVLLVVASAFGAGLMYLYSLQ